LSRAEAARSTMGDVVPLEVLERVAEELRRHGVRARVRPDWRGVPDVYIDYDDLDRLFQLCDREVLSREARELLC